jgi:hypothetical protein
VALLLAGLLLLFFLTPIVRHEVLSPADLLQSFVPWKGTQPPRFEPANALLSDYVFQFKPWRDFATDALRAGRLPLWNPHNYAGAPLLGNGQSAVLYPLNVPFLVLPDAWAVLAWAGLRLLVAGLSSYLFARVIGLTALGATVTSLGFTFSGFLVVWLLWPHVNVAVWLPALLLASEALVRRPTALRAALLALVVGIQFLGGHPGTIVHVLSAVALYVAWRVVLTARADRDWRGAGRRLAAFVGALAVGTALAAIQLVPLGEYVTESAALHDRASPAASVWSPSRPRVLAMGALVCPYCFGSPLRGDLPISAVIGLGNFNELSGGYVGIVSLVLVAVALGLGARRGVDLFFVALAALAFCLVYEISPIVNLINALPPFRTIQNARALLLLAFALAVLAGRGMDVLVSARDARAARLIGIGRALALAGLAGLAVVAAGLVVARTFRATILETLKARVAAGAGVYDFAALLPEYYDRLIGLAARQGAGRAVWLGVAGLAIVLVVSAPRRRLVAWIVPALVVLDLFTFGRDYNPSIPRALEYPATPAIDFVRAQPGLFRVLTLDGGLPPNANMPYGLSEVRGYDALETPAYRKFLAATGDYPRPYSHFPTLYFSNVGSALIDLLGVRYVISARALEHPKLALVRDGPARVYENRRAMPRAFMVYRTRILESERDVEAALAAPDFDPRAVALFDRDGVVAAGPVDPAGEATVVEYRPERVVVEVSTAHDGVLVLADAWFPGWEASVDGRPAGLRRADLLLRAVAVPAGRHRVVVRYAPRSVALGAAISGVGVAVLAAVGVDAARRRRRRGAEGL